MCDSWRAWYEEAIHVKMKEPGSGQKQLGGIMRVKSTTRNCPTEKTGTSKQDQSVNRIFYLEKKEGPNNSS